MPAVLTVTGDGRVLMRGTLTAVDGNTLTLRSWGGQWTITAASGASVTPALGDMSAGDFVGIIGTIDPATTTALSATVVRDWTTNP